MSAGFRSFSSFWWGPDGLGRPTKTYPSGILLQKVGIENSAPSDILIAKKDIESGIVGDILLKKLDAYSELGSDIVVVRLGFPGVVLEARISTLRTRAIGYGMVYHMKISDIEKAYYNSISISKRAIKLKDRKPPYERRIIESSVVSIGVRDVDDELEKQSREYPEDVEPERDKSKVSIEDYNDLL